MSLSSAATEVIDPGCSTEYINYLKGLFPENYIEPVCQAVRDNCDAESNFDFYDMYYCTMEQNIWKYVFLGVRLPVHGYRFS